MTDVILERDFDPPLDLESFAAKALEQFECFDLYQVEWQQSLLAQDRRHMVCWFRGVDAESVRSALRQNEVDIRVLWRGTHHEAPGAAADAAKLANVAVERQFDAATTFDAVQRIESAGIHYLAARDVEPVCTLFSADRRRMICLYRAPDTDSVRQAQHEAGMPFTSLWSFEVLSPDVLQSFIPGTVASPRGDSA